ncbi:hypothetical protein N665_0098s0011 [Sinapis alba]|nr:hypothetical protein N665_0098s0011 [Sinapis alba]
MARQDEAGTTPPREGWRRSLMVKETRPAVAAVDVVVRWSQWWWYGGGTMEAADYLVGLRVFLRISFG